MSSKKGKPNETKREEQDIPQKLGIDATLFLEFKGLLREYDKDVDQDFINAFKYTGMDISESMKVIIDILKDKTKSKLLFYCIVWMIKAGGNMSEKRMDKFAETEKMRAAKTGIGLVEAKSNIKLAKQDLTFGRIGAVMHPYIIGIYISMGDKLKPAAGVEFSSKFKFGKFHALFHSTWSVYAYDKASDNAAGLVGSAILDYTVGHHSKVNPANEAGERYPFNMQIYKTKMENSMVLMALKEDFTKNVLSTLEFNGYTPMSEFPEDYNYFVTDAAKHTFGKSRRRGPGGASSYI